MADFIHDDAAVEEDGQHVLDIWMGKLMGPSKDHPEGLQMELPLEGVDNGKLDATFTAACRNIFWCS